METDTSPDPSEAGDSCQARREGRRKMLKGGIALVPVLVTLHARPASAETDYSVVAYRYGVNAGMINKNFGKENARPQFRPVDDDD